MESHAPPLSSYRGSAITTQSDIVRAGQINLKHDLFPLTITPCRTFASNNSEVPVWRSDVRVDDVFDESSDSRNKEINSDSLVPLYQFMRQ
jgi:hypothetical protein